MGKDQEIHVFLTQKGGVFFSTYLPPPQKSGFLARVGRMGSGRKLDWGMHSVEKTAVEMVSTTKKASSADLPRVLFACKT